MYVFKIRLKEENRALWQVLPQFWRLQFSVSDHHQDRPHRHCKHLVAIGTFRYVIFTGFMTYKLESKESRCCLPERKEAFMIRREINLYP